MQEDGVIAYPSQQLKPYKKIYPTHYLKLVAIAFTFKIWTTTCLMHPFEFSSITKASNTIHPKRTPHEAKALVIFHQRL